MKDINEIIEQLGMENTITLEDMPKIDLYMDQVIQLFENTYSETKRHDSDKVMTKTMINNYAKGKVFFPIKNKKYSKEHLILLSMIYHLKGALSINDIKATLQGINDKIGTDNINLDAFYNVYLEVFEKNVESFKKDVDIKAEEVNEEVAKLDDQNRHYLEQILLISSFVNTSNMYRKLAEKLIDNLEQPKKE
jgi:DNA-binding transcriptional MerR regulator